MYTSGKIKPKEYFDQNVPEVPVLHCLLSGLIQERNLGVYVNLCIHN